MPQHRTIATTVWFLALISLSALADTTLWSADKARDALQKDNFILLDIRSVQEWEETGLAAGAWPVSLHEPGFGEKLGSIIQGNQHKTIGLICATGARSTRVFDKLKSMGVSNFVNVSEGMLGSDLGPGWIERGLPTVSLDEARKTLEQAQQATAKK